MVRREKLVQLRRAKGSPIAGSHFERLGTARVWVGGGSMYLCIPMFAALRAGVVAIDHVVAPILGLRPTPVGQYIVLDRHEIEGLPWFDKLNCDYCGYANGMSMLLHARLDQLAGARRSRLAEAAFKVVAAALSPWQASFVHFLYGVLISRPLGFARLSRQEADQRLERAGYPARLRAQKRFAMQLEAALEQIESAWCPLKHLRQGVYPDHHRNFFEPHDIPEMRQVLRTVGTVSRRGTGSPP